nr:hypothetical protein [Tanacetum cinerariifolium]
MKEHLSGGLIEVMKGLSECKASESNVRRIQVKDIVKEVEDNLKTYSSAGMDIRCVVDENLPQLLDSRGGSHVTNIPDFDKEDFTSWKVRFLVFLNGLKPYLVKTLEDRPFVPMSSLSTSENPLPKRQNQWSNAKSHLVNQDKQLKSIIISCLSNDVIKSVIKCKTTKKMWNDLILAHGGPSDIKDTKIAALRLKFNAFKSLEVQKINKTFTTLKCLLNDLEKNGVAERRNRTLIEAARTMLNSVKLPKQFWGEAVNTACYIQNRSIIVKRHGKTSYDVFRERSPDISYFHVFRCPVHIHNHNDHLGKFDEKADDGFFLGYSLVAKAFRVFNIRRQEMEETVHVTFSEDDEAIAQSSTKGDAINFNENRSFPNDEFLEPKSEVTQCLGNTEYFPYIPVYENTTPSESPILQVSIIPEDPPKFTEADNHLALNEHDQTEAVVPFEPVKPQNNVIIEPISDVQPSPTISPSAEVFLQTHVPQDRWSKEKHIELVNIICEPLTGITTKSKIIDSDAASASECLYVNFLSKMEPKKLIEALEEKGRIIAMQEELNQFERSKGYNHPEGIDYKETFAHVARLEAIRIFLAYAAYMSFMVYHMDVKSALLNRKTSEEVYVQQPLRFESSEYPNHVCKLDKALYGLKQAPRAWYETLLKFLIQHKFVREKYVKDLLKKYDLADCALVKCLMLPPNNLGPDESGVSVNETLFRDMIGSLMHLTTSRPNIQFSTCLCARYQAKPMESHLIAVKRIFRGKLVCWSAKKQSSVALSSSEAEYVAAAGCCAQVLWIKSQDYDVLYAKVPIFCDNTSAIVISNNPVLHSRTKHIDISLPIYKDVVPLPPKETVRDGLATLAKLYKEPEQSLIPPSGEVNADDTVDKSLSKASMQFITQSKAPTDLKTKHKIITPSYKPKSPHKVRAILPKKQVAKTQHAEVTVATANATNSLEAYVLVLDQNVKEKDDEFVAIEEVAEEQSLELPIVEQLLNEADKLNKAVQETPKSPYDTQSKIKVVKSFFTSHISELKDQTMHDSEEIADIHKGSESDLQSMPDDDLGFVLGFYTTDSENSHENKDMVSLLEAVEVFKNANAEGEKWEKNNPAKEKDAQYHNQTNGEQILGANIADIVHGEKPSAQVVLNKEKALVVHNPKEKKSKGTVSKEDDLDDDDLDKQPLSKIFKIMTLIPNPIPLNTFVLKHLLKPEQQ